MTDTYVTVEEIEEDGVLQCAIKISLPLFEINVAIPRADIEQLRLVPTVNWTTGALRLGTSAGASVFWCAGEGGVISVMVGHDDQTWDISLTLPGEVIQMICNDLPSSSGKA